MDGDHLSIVPVSFHYKGKLICNIDSFVYPQFSIGDTFQIDLLPTNRERTRRPAQDFRSAFFKIEKVHHVANEIREGVFTFRVEVLLGDVDASNAEIDSETIEPSIPRRLLKPDK